MFAVHSENLWGVHVCGTIPEKMFVIAYRVSAGIMYYLEMEMHHDIVLVSLSTLTTAEC